MAFIGCFIHQLESLGENMLGAATQPGSNDPYGETLHSILSLVRAKYLSIAPLAKAVPW